MAWVTPKVNWQTSDHINYTDYNRIKNNVTQLYSVVLFMRKNTSTIYVEPEEAYATHKTNYNDDVQLLFYVYDGSGTQVGYYELIGYGEIDVFVENTSDVGQTFTIVTYRSKRGYTYFDIDDMGNDKAVNDLWYADEFNTIIDNIDKIAEELGMDFGRKPFYAPNGATPTAFELNVIEQTERNIYNVLNGAYTIYIGMGGYCGTRIQNTIL